MLLRLIAGALALACTLASPAAARGPAPIIVCNDRGCSTPTASTPAPRHARARQAHAPSAPGGTGPMVYDNDGRILFGGAMPDFSSLIAPAAAVASDRPRDCYGIAWCGCWLRHQLGLADRALNAAINWARVGSPASVDTANIVVWSHHVGELLDHRVDPRRGLMLLVRSGNDGGAVRTRWRPAGRVAAYRKV